LTFPIEANVLGKPGTKDKHGRPEEIGHHGRNLRVTSTGRFSLQQVVNAGRVGLTVSTSHGLCLRSTQVRGTLFATHNVLFMLRGEVDPRFWTAR